MPWEAGLALAVIAISRFKGGACGSGYTQCETLFVFEQECLGKICNR